MNDKKGSKPIVNVGIYLRKSRAEDGVQDLQKHEDYLLKICHNNNWTFELYKEIESSQDLFRPELQRMRQDIALRKLDAILVFAVDRLSRKTRHFLEIVEDYLVEQGVVKLYEKEALHDLTDKTTITLLTMKATMSQAEYAFIVERMGIGRKESLKKGIITGKLVYGYCRDPETKLAIPHPEESKVARLIVDLTLEGKTYKGIAEYLNAIGHRTRKNNLWDIYNIKSILHSPTLRGHLIFKWENEQIVVRDINPALMTEAEYSKIIDITKNRADNYKGLTRAPKHWLQGLLTCPNCGKVMTIAGNKPHRKKLPDGTVERSGDYVYYIRACRPYIKQAERCGNKGCQVVLIEDIIRDLVTDYQQVISQGIATLLETNIDEHKKVKKDVIADLKKAIQKLERKEEGLLDLLLDDTIDKATYNNKINSIKKEKADLLNQIDEAQSRVEAVDIEQELKHQYHLKSAIEEWDSISDQQKREILQMLLAKIEYTRFDKETEPTLTFDPCNKKTV